MRLRSKTFWVGVLVTWVIAIPLTFLIATEWLRYTAIFLVGVIIGGYTSELDRARRHEHE